MASSSDDGHGDGQDQVQRAGAGHGQDDDDRLGPVGHRGQGVERQGGEALDGGDAVRSRCPGRRGGPTAVPTRSCRTAVWLFHAGPLGRCSCGVRPMSSGNSYARAGTCIVRSVGSAGARCLGYWPWNCGNSSPGSAAATPWPTIRTPATATCSRSSVRRSARTACSKSGESSRSWDAPPSWRPSAATRGACRPDGGGGGARHRDAATAAGARRAGGSIVRHNVTNIRFESVSPTEITWRATSWSSPGAASITWGDTATGWSRWATTG